MTLLTFRKEQFAVFDNQARNEIFEELYMLMSKSYPDECTRLGQEGACLRIENACRHAQETGINEFRNIKRYLHLLFTFGVDTFGVSTNTQWAAAVLEWETDENKKLAVLEHRAQKILYPEQMR